MTAQHRKEALARALAMQWAADVPFRRALLRLYRTHCRNLPAGPGAAVPDPLRDAIAAHYGEALTAPSMQPAFAHWNLSDVEGLAADLDDAAGWAGAYLAALARLAHRYGLDRWQPPDGRGASRSYGEILVHEWCTLRAGYGFGPQRFADAVGSQPGWVPRRALGRTLEPGSEPYSAARLYLSWDPRSEPYSEDRRGARARLHSAVDAELKAIRAEWQTAGFEFTVPAEGDRDAGWVFQRLRGRTVAEIAGADFPGEDPVTATDRVQKATHRLAVKLRVTFR